MFAERNSDLLHPVDNSIDGNEYFIDRNGCAFYYILEFYRTGKILWRPYFNPMSDMKSTILAASSLPPKYVTREELEEEMHYFQLPIRSIWSSFSQRAAAAKVDQFITTLQEVMHEVAGEFSAKVQIVFRRNKHPPHVKVEGVDVDTAAICEHVKHLIKPLGSVGYTVLDKFGSNIGYYLKCAIPELQWELRHVDNYNWYSLQMSVEDESFDYDGVLENTCLATSKSLEY